MRVNPANRSASFLRTILLSGFLLFSFSVLNAQVDTVEVVDEGVKVPDEIVDEDYSEEATDTQKEEDFLYTSAYDSVRFQQRRLPANALKEMQEDDDFWYANADAEREKQKATTPPKREVKNGQQKENEIEEPEKEPYVPVSRQGWFQTLMWIVIVAGFAGALMWYLAGSNVGLFRKKDKKIVGGEEDEQMPEDIFAINYQKEIDKAASLGNYRLAIRLMYLRVLKNLAEKEIIRYKQDRTNFDYLVQLHQTAHYNGFFRITRHYEYSWYGKFNVSDEAYGVIRTEFDHFEKTTG